MRLRSFCWLALLAGVPTLSIPHPARGERPRCLLDTSPGRPLGTASSTCAIRLRPGRWHGQVPRRWDGPVRSGGAASWPTEAPRALLPLTGGRSRARARRRRFMRASRNPTYTRFDGEAEGQIVSEFRATEGVGASGVAGEYTSSAGSATCSSTTSSTVSSSGPSLVGVGVPRSTGPECGAGSGSGGHRPYLGRDFFLTGELKRRFSWQGHRARHRARWSPGKSRLALVGMGFLPLLTPRTFRHRRWNLMVA